MNDDDTHLPSPSKLEPELLTLLLIVSPGFLSCLIFQCLWFSVHASGETFSQIEAPSVEPLGWKWLVPGIFWPTWLIISLFFILPAIFEGLIRPLGFTTPKFSSRMAEMGVRLLGIPTVLLGLIVGFNLPGRSLAGWTVFHYSLALISSIIAEYRMQYRSPG